LPETVRITKERILKSLQEELNDHASQRKNQKMSKKYRMVKFFGKQTKSDSHYKIHDRIQSIIV